MLSTPDTTNDSREVLEIAPDVVLVARAAADFPALAPEALGRTMEPEPHPASDFAATAAPRVDTTFRASNVNDIVGGRASSAHWLRRSALAFLLALCGAFATAAWERYGDNAQALATSLGPQIVPTMMSWLPWQQRPAAAQPDAAAPQAAAASQAPLAPQQTDGAAAAQSPESAQALQSMARDVANLTQQIEGLKASIAQLKATQDQLAQQLTKPPEPRVAEARAAAEPRPKQLGAPPRPLGTLVHKPKPVAYPPVQAAIAPPPPPPGATPPVQIAPSAGPTAAQPDTDPIVRPPMPVR